MALKLGELVAYLKADDDQFQKSLKKAQKDWEKHGEKLKDSAKVFAAAAAVAIGAGLVAGMDLDAARAKLAAQVGDPALAKQLGEAAGAVYGRGFGQTAADSMLAARAVMQAGLLPKGADAAVIEDLTVKAQTLATTFDLDVTQAARAAGTMVRTGLAGNATEAFDILTRGMQVTGDQAGDLLDTFSEYSTQFREVGISGPKAMGMLAQAVKGGARDIDTAADAIKEFAIRSQDGTAQSAAGFKALNLNAKDMTATFAKGGPEADKAMKMVLDRLKAMKDPVEQRAAAVALFGTKAEDLGDALYAIDPTKAVAGLGELAGATDKAGKSLEDTASQKLEKFKRQAQQALVEKISQALPTLERLGTWASDNSGTLLTLAGVLGTVAATVWAVNAATKAWAAAQLIVKGATVAWTGVQWLLNAAMYANPIGLIVLAIVALIAGIWLLWENSSAFRDFWIKVWDAIWGAIKAVGRWFKDTLWPWMKDVWDKIKGAAGKAKDWIVEKWDAMIGFFKGLPGKLRKAVGGMWDGIKDSFKAAVNWIIRKWNDLSLTIGGGSIMGVSIPRVTLNTPNIPMLAQGGTALTAGAAIVGENGPELLHMTRGATVQPLSGGGGGEERHIHLHARFVMPGGREIRDELIDYAYRTGQNPANLFPAPR